MLLLCEAKLLPEREAAFLWPGLSNNALILLDISDSCNYRKVMVDRPKEMDDKVPSEPSPPNNERDTSGTSPQVIIIGAGAAGLTAGYDLSRKGFRIQILEANTCMGGRLRKLVDFADFPIDLGGQWLHTDPKILKTIVNDPSVDVKVKTKHYDFNPFRDWKKGKWRVDQVIESEFHKFVGYTWFDFFADYIAKPIQDSIQYGCVVKSIDYSNDTVIVECRDGRIFQGDQVIVTVSLKILQDGDILFKPPLPANKLRAIENAPFEPGLKVFFQFTERFYFKDFDIYQNNLHGERYFFDESWDQDTNQCILGVFMYGQKSLKYVDMDDEEIAKSLLSELDERFGGRASKSYVKHFGKCMHESS